MSLNKVMLIGNVGRDPEVKYLAGDRVVTTFSLATSETYTDKTTNEKRTDTEWHRIEMWDNLAKIAEKYIHKGSQIYVEGKLKSESWKDKDGNEKTGIKIRVSSLTLLGGKGNNDPKPPTTGKTEGIVNRSNDKTENDEPIPTRTDDDLPF
jgi:single-strand DNA-binding protein